MNSRRVGEERGGKEMDRCPLTRSFPPLELERSYLFGCCHYYIPHTYRTCTLKE
jgi:hypothetical protein